MNLGVSIVEQLETSESREMGSDAIFTISSAKPGNGVDQLRDNNLDTYWQSDGSFPHYINIQFLHKVSINKLCLYLDYSSDESYTPRKISISSGTSMHDLIDITTIELNEPVGWVSIDMVDPSIVDSNCLRTHLLQVKILSMHQNGRDTHIRQLKVLGPRISPQVMGDLAYSSFKTSIMREFSLIR
eukprot:gene4448-6291_t